MERAIVVTPDHTLAYIGEWAVAHALPGHYQKPLVQTVGKARVVARVTIETLPGIDAPAG